jgi:adenosylhomocysteine nucleosidase
LVSFGLAGGLDPALRPGMIIIPSIVLTENAQLRTNADLAERFGGLTGHTILAGSTIAATAAGKQHLRADTQADAIDLESGAVARTAEANGLPFAVVRAICDPAERDLPNAALVALDSRGRVGFFSVLRSVLAHPFQVPGLLFTACYAAQARHALLRLADQINISMTQEIQPAASRSSR